MRQIRRVAQHATLLSTLHQQLLFNQLPGAGPVRAADYRVDLVGRRFVLTRDDGVPLCTARAQQIAQVSVRGVVQWLDQEPNAGLPDTESALEAIRTFGQNRHLDELTLPEVPLDTAHARAITLDGTADPLAAAAHQVGEAAIDVLGLQYRYLCADDPGGPRVVLLDKWDRPPPGADLARFAEVVRSRGPWCDDLAWSLQGAVALMPQWEFAGPAPQVGSPGQGTAQITDSTAGVLSIDWPAGHSRVSAHLG